MWSVVECDKSYMNILYKIIIKIIIKPSYFDSCKIWSNNSNQNTTFGRIKKINWITHFEIWQNDKLYFIHKKNKLREYMINEGKLLLVKLVLVFMGK